MALHTRILLFTTVLLATAAPTTLAATAAAPTTLAAPKAAAASSGASARTPTATTDPTITRRARASRSARSGVSVRAWANSPTARRVAARESGGNCRAKSRSGKYRGKWQMDANFWRAYGGRKYAATPDRASCAQQDVVAHRGWVDRWWRPWSTF